MSTTKTRINVSLSSTMEKAIVQLAKRDSVPEATKASELLRIAIELDEDIALGKLASFRDTKHAKFVNEKKVWEKYAL